MNERDGRTQGRAGIGGLSYRTILGLVIAALVVLFIALNRDETEVSFVLFDQQTSLWVALTFAAAGGFVAGFLIGRRRYRT
jgi:uncharacterized integral membrane protein